MTQETGIAKRNPDPYNCKAPSIGQAILTPIHHPIGLQPHFKHQSQLWDWINGNQPDPDPTQYTNNEV